VQYGEQPGLQLASRTKPSEIPILEGDLHALRLVDLDSLGLGFFRNSSISSNIEHAIAGSTRISNSPYSHDSVAASFHTIDATTANSY
jgi:hypothetical protein